MVFKRDVWEEIHVSTTQLILSIEERSTKNDFEIRFLCLFKKNQYIAQSNSLIKPKTAKMSSDTQFLLIVDNRNSRYFIDQKKVERYFAFSINCVSSTVSGSPFVPRCK